MNAPSFLTKFFIQKVSAKDFPKILLFAEAFKIELTSGRIQSFLDQVGGYTGLFSRDLPAGWNPNVNFRFYGSFEFGQKYGIPLLDHSFVAPMGYDDALEKAIAKEIRNFAGKRVLIDKERFDVSNRRFSIGPSIGGVMIIIRHILPLPTNTSLQGTTNSPDNFYADGSFPAVWTFQWNFSRDPNKRIGSHLGWDDLQGESYKLFENYRLATEIPHQVDRDRILLRAFCQNPRDCDQIIKEMEDLLARTQFKFSRERPIDCAACKCHINSIYEQQCPHCKKKLER